MSKHRILIVDDELNIRRILQAAFDKEGYHTLIAEDARTAVQTLEQESVDCVLTDVTMPGASGFELQREIHASWPHIPVVIMTAFGTIPQAVQAMRDGAHEFITKPFDLDHLKKVISSAVTAAPPAPKRATAKAAKSGFIAEAPAMQEVVELIDQAADSRATVLVTGESGTGKEVVAKRLHTLSSRAEESFVAVSCAALPETLMESELFGHEKGAFTGADHAKPGRFEAADKGTLFLDEIGDVPPLIQVKLLRVLQEREFERLGARKPTKVDVRLIAATNRDLQRMVDDGDFRLDLMYRLQVIEIKLPPLRERPEDIRPLAELFLAKYAADNGRSLSAIEPDAMALLEAGDWAGNVRELENAIERAVVLAEPEADAVSVKHLPPHLRKAA